MLMVLELLKTTGLLTISTTHNIKLVDLPFLKLLTHFHTKIRDAIVTKKINLLVKIWNSKLKLTGEEFLEKENLKLKRSELLLLLLQPLRKLKKKELLRKKE